MSEPQKIRVGKLVTFSRAKNKSIGIVVASNPGPGCEQHTVAVPHPNGPSFHGPFMTHELTEADGDVET